ncbi:ARID DNA-binding domain-containing protein [Tanacetum coccineum]
MDKKNSSYGKWQRTCRYSHGILKQSHPKENSEGSICVYNLTQAKIIQNKNMVKCFKCQETGHFANKCPPNNQGQPKISLKYPDFIHFKTKGIVKGTDMETWDDFWMRQKHNDYLDEYYESLDKERKGREEEMPRYVEDTDTQEIHTFNEFVAFLNLIKNDNMISKGWDIYRQKFDKRRRHKSLEEYQWKIGKMGASNAAEKGKEKLEHFGIKLEEEEDCKLQQSTHYGREES